MDAPTRTFVSISPSRSVVRAPLHAACSARTGVPVLGGAIWPYIELRVGVAVPLLALPTDELGTGIIECRREAGVVMVVV